jgi:hypothetical protein
MHTIEKFIAELENENLSEIGFSENLYAGNSRESRIRKQNLLTYLVKMKSLNPKFLLLGEAPGHKGCRLTGIPFTSEKILANHPFFKNLNFQFINDNLESEQSATIVWNLLQNCDNKPLIWNIFPFHPYDGLNQNTNRTPNQNELEIGKKYLLILLDIFKINLIAAVGRKPESKLKEIGIQYQYVRHPANGGKNKFVIGINKLMNQL